MMEKNVPTPNTHEHGHAFTAQEGNALKKFGTISALFLALTAATAPEAHADQVMHNSSGIQVGGGGRAHQEMRDSSGVQIGGNNSDVTITIDGARQGASTQGGGTGNVINFSTNSPEDAPSDNPSYYCEDSETTVEGPNNVVRNTVVYTDGTRVTIEHRTDDEGMENIKVTVKRPGAKTTSTTCQ